MDSYWIIMGVTPNGDSYYLDYDKPEEYAWEAHAIAAAQKLRREGYADACVVRLDPVLCWEGDE